MASTYLYRTSGTPTSQKKGTFSFWVKRSGLGSTTRLFNNHVTSVYYGYIDFTGGDKFRVAGDDAGTISVQTNRLFRDTNAWYHIVVAIDTTQSTASDRVKIYVNGVQETSMAVGTYPSQNDNLNFLSTSASNGHVVGAYYNGSAYSGGFDGLMSHIHFIDGTAYDASAFGETDANGVWKIKTSPSVTYGTNGFFILKDGNSVTDQSGNSNNFTVGGGTLTKTEDSPSNVFATISPLYYSAEKAILEFGNLRRNGHAIGESAAWRSLFATLGASSGKYYFETKIETSTAGNNFWIGIVDDEQIVATGDNGEFYNTSRGYAYGGQSGTKGNNATDSSYGDTYTTNDIIGCAFDLDNHKIYWSKNGVWQNSGDPTSGATGTGSAFNLATGYTYIPSFATFNNDERYAINFGNGYFSTTAVASAGTNASGNGIFEYDVPTGYTALSTKGLNL